MAEWLATDSQATGRLPEVSARVKDTVSRSAGTVVTVTQSLWVIAIFCVLTSLLFFGTLSSMVATWLRSQTFSHGFLILPMVLWMLWRTRTRFYGLVVTPQPLALLFVLGAGCVWWLAHLVDVLVIQQLAFVTVLVSGIWAIVGTNVVRRAAFPLGFLYLSVPMGAGLIPPLMQFTADTTEYMIRASGIPVLREGMYLSLPTGNWSVIEECSGVRYLIAFVTLGLLYGWMTYTSPWRRLAFALATVVVSILANSLRAYLVVMVGHLSEMRYGIGQEHLLYGWLFFGVVMFLMFWVGGFWRQPTERPADAAPPRAFSLAPPWSRPVRFCGLALVCAALWPVLSLGMERTRVEVPASPLQLPPRVAAWQAQGIEDEAWYPRVEGADREFDQHYRRSNDDAGVSIHLRQFIRQQQGMELVSSLNPWRPDRERWRLISQGSVPVALDRPTTVDEVVVVSPEQSLLLWSWYRLDGWSTANPYLAKLLEARQQILTGMRHGTRIFVATPLDELGDRAAARERLQHFLQAYYPELTLELDSGVGE